MPSGSRPKNLRPLFTGGLCESRRISFDEYIRGFDFERLVANEVYYSPDVIGPDIGKIKKHVRGPIYHAGRRVGIDIPKIRPVWKDDYGAFRVGRTGDMIQMFQDLGVSDRSF